MKKTLKICFLLLVCILICSCKNLLNLDDSKNYGKITFTLPTTVASRSAVDVSALEYGISVINSETGQTKTQTAAGGESVSIELLPGTYNLKVTAYNQDKPDERLYGGQTANIEVTAGKNTATKITLYKTIDLTGVLEYWLLDAYGWGDPKYGCYQGTLDITYLFSDELPEKGESVNFVWKGKSTRDIKNLYFRIAESYFENESEDSYVYHNLFSEESDQTPILTSIKADTEFEVDIISTFQETATHNVNLYWAVGEADAEGSLCLYTGEKVTPQDLDPPGLEVVNETIKITDPGKKFLLELLTKGCDGYYIGIISGKCEDGTDRWIMQKKVHLTDADVLWDVDFTDDFINPEVEIWDDKIKPFISFYKNIDSSEGDSQCLSYIVSSEVTYEPTPYLKELAVLGKRFGSINYQANLSGNTITWLKDTDSGNVGWYLYGTDLSDYDRIRVEIESTEHPIDLQFEDENWSNNHCFNFVEPNVFEAELTGDGASWIMDGGTNFDKSKGINIIIETSYVEDDYILDKDYHTVVKSVQLLTGHRNESLKIGTALLVPICDSYVYEGGKITFTEQYGYAGWKVSDQDFSGKSKIKLTVEGDANIRLRLVMSNGCHAYSSVTNGIIEANLDGSEATSGYATNQPAWEKGLSLSEIHISCEDEDPTGKYITIKSITLE